MNECQIPSVPIAFNEPERLAQLAQYQIMFSEKEPAFDRITQLAQCFFQTSMAGITFIDKDTQFAKSSVGCQMSILPRDIAICNHTIADSKTLVILDMLLDSRFKKNPLVVSEPFLRFYAGASILVKNAQGEEFALGALCVFDTLPRAEFSEKQVEMLEQFAKLVGDALESRLQKQKAQRADEIKSAFLANMSHEIRTPMNGILGMLDLLSQTPVSPQQQEYISHLKNSNEHLLNIANDILDLSKIESGKMQFTKTAINLKDVCEQVIAIFHLTAYENGIDLIFDYPQDLPKFVKTDPVRVRQILVNLVNNAIKFTPTGGKVRLQAINGADDCEIKLQVIDTGCGIRAESQAVIFDAYNQADKFTHRVYGGTGLGLSVCKALAEGMGGTITVDSKICQGSTFSLCLPFEMLSDGDYQSLCINDDFLSQSKIRLPAHILLAEDNQLNAMVAIKSLKKFGYTVDLAKDGQEAVNLFSDNPDKYQVILMDHQMPIMDGVQATKELKKRFDKLPPIIAVTAHAMHGDKDIYLKVGMQDYCTKPYKPEFLDNMIQTWLKNYT
ncbi:GAF domain-containing hybrid sensor histidine kinase/response regulator [Faucicola boevrei]|uniref:GAF domain-containing hybrid sensor histidine kinase/response regulator n=1 Tax=Faucicola boevrei TaxID=346665 RepID=UPI000372578D|nr:GAF domain-containing hybrid sensor histidine kinase/response regulator [Moraxella boevrei]